MIAPVNTMNTIKSEIELLERNAKTHIDSYTVKQIEDEKIQKIWRVKILELAEVLRKAEKLTNVNNNAR